jgi:hypothetical protein
MIETKHPTEPLSTFDDSDCRFGAIAGLAQPVVDALMIPLPVVMSGVLAGCLPQRPFTEEDHLVVTLILDRPDEPLGIRVQVGRPVGQSHGFDGLLYANSTQRHGIPGHWWKPWTTS